MYKFTEGQVRRAIKFLKKDMHDDWYCDLQNYSDLFTDVPFLVKQLNERVVKGDGVYAAERSILFNIPKGNGGFRYTLELSPLDRLAYHVFGIELIEILDKSISFRILSHRRSTDDETLFKPAVEQWNKFENYLRVSASDKYIIETDLSNYFENIDIGKLRGELVISATRAKLSSEAFLRCMYMIDSTIAILRTISFDGKKGLPQNRDISSFLANIYMCHLDARLQGRTYFRYVDDIRIVAPNRAEANQTMLELVECLREYGLSLNSQKTRILVPGTDDHSVFVNDFDFEAKKIEAMLNSRRRKFVNESFQSILSGTILMLEKKAVHERKFRFYSNRLATFLNAKDVVVPPKYRKLVAERLVGALEGRPDCADQICTLVQALGPNRGLQESLVVWATSQTNQTYEWAVYTVIKTLVEQGYRNPNLRLFCLGALSDTKKSDPIIGISAVYLNSVATKRIQTVISKDNTHFLQRHLLIALSRVPPKNLRDNGTATKIRDDFVGQHYRLSRLSRSKDFSFVNRSERHTQKYLIKELRNYV